MCVVPGAGAGVDVVSHRVVRRPKVGDGPLASRVTLDSASEVVKMECLRAVWRVGAATTNPSRTEGDVTPTVLAMEPGDGTAQLCTATRCPCSELNAKKVVQAMGLPASASATSTLMSGSLRRVGLGAAGLCGVVVSYLAAAHITAGPGATTARCAPATRMAARARELPSTSTLLSAASQVTRTPTIGRVSLVATSGRCPVG